MLKTLFLFACAAVFTQPLQADDMFAKEQLEGQWAVTAASAAGKQVELPHTWTFKTNGKANVVDRKEGKQSLFRYKLDDSVAPHRIELVYLGPDDRLKNLRQIGIWKLDGDHLTLLLQQPTTASESNDDTYPTNFAKPDPDTMLMTLERLNFE